MPSLSNFKLGRKPPRIDHRTLKLAKYLGELPAPPPQAGYVRQVAIWPMYLNDNLGCCVVAGAGHLLENWNVYATRGSGLVTDQDILTAYEAVGGYVPGDPSTDNGCMMLDMLNYWRKTGLGGHKIVAFASVNPQNETEIKQTIKLFGGCYIGLNLPVSAQNTFPGENSFPVWDVPAGGPVGDGAPGGWGGHCIELVGYGADSKGYSGTEGITWGQVYDISWPFLSNYCEEAWAVVTEDFIAQDGKAPSGFDLNTLQADLKLLS